VDEDELDDEELDVSDVSVVDELVSVDELDELDSSVPAHPWLIVSTAFPTVPLQVTVTFFSNADTSSE
jgi:hypothetical protein